MLITDPVDLPVDAASGDLVLTAGKVILTTGVTAAVQGVRIRLQMIAGEWFLDLDAGVPYFERVGVPAAKAIYGQKYDQGKAERAIRTAIAAAPGIVKVGAVNVVFTGSTRGISTTWQAATAFGDTPADTLALGK